MRILQSVWDCDIRDESVVVDDLTIQILEVELEEQGVMDMVWYGTASLLCHCVWFLGVPKVSGQGITRKARRGYVSLRLFLDHLFLPREALWLETQSYGEKKKKDEHVNRRNQEYGAEL